MGRKNTEALIVLLSFPIIANIEIIKNIICIVMHYPYPKTTLFYKIFIVLTCIAIICAMHCYLATNKRMKVIFKEFEDITNKEKHILNVLYFLYLTVSFTLAIYLSNIIRAKEYLNW